MSVKTGLFGRPERMDRVQRYEPWQQQNDQRLAQMGMQGLQNPTAGFEPMQQETMRQFNEEQMPSMFNRIGALGGGHSGSYNQAGTQASQDLMTRLNAQKAQWGQGNIQNYMNMIQQGQRQQSDPFFRQRQPGMFENIGNQMMGNLFSNGPQMLGRMFGGKDAEGKDRGVAGLPAWGKILGMFL